MRAFLDLLLVFVMACIIVATISIVFTLALIFNVCYYMVVLIMDCVSYMVGQQRARSGHRGPVKQEVYECFHDFTSWVSRNGFTRMTITYSVEPAAGSKPEVVIDEPKPVQEPTNNHPSV